MVQMVQQALPQQAAPAQTAQAAPAVSAQDADAFSARVRSAVKTAGKEKKTADLSEPEEGGEDRGREEKNSVSFQALVASPAFLIPFRAADVAGSTLPSPAVSQGTSADGASALQEIVSAATPDRPGVRETGTPIPQGGKTAELPQAAQVAPAAEPAEKTEAASSPVSAPKAPVGENVPAAESSEAQVPVPVSEKTTETAPVKSSEQPKASAAVKQPPDVKPVVKSSGNGRLPQKETDDSKPKETASSLSGLYASGNVVVKVSDAKAVQKPQAARQIAQAVAQQAKQGKQEFEVELYPQSLGKVSVRLSSENGVLTVKIAAANPKTQSLLLSGSENIRSLLQASTGKNVNLVGAQQSGGWYARQDGENSGYRQQEQNPQEKRKEPEAWRKIRGVGTMDTGAFLSLMQQVAQ